MKKIQRKSYLPTAFFSGMLSLSLAFAAPISAADSESVSETVFQTESEQETSEQEEISAYITEGNNALAAHLISCLYEEGQNLFFSPYSIYSAISMLSHCSSEQNEAKKEILSVLGIPDSIDEQSFADAQSEIIDKLMENRLAKNDPQSSLPVSSFETANALLVNEQLSVSPDFSLLEDFLSSYRAMISFCDLSSTETMTDINNWVKEHTHEMIPEIFSEPLSNDTAAVLLNAVYFYGQWRNLFSESETEKADFHGTAGNTTVDMMHLTEDMSYLETDDYQILKLPYENGYTMTVYLPKSGDSVSDWTDPALLADLFSVNQDSFAQYRVTLSMPKFEQEYSSEISSALKELGIELAFEEDSELFDRVSELPIGLSSILHKAKIAVNETGTEASAVTAIVARSTGIIEPLEEVEVNLNHPFLYTISNDAANLIVFAGNVSNLQ